jgi:hypothetical protein
LGECLCRKSKLEPLPQHVNVLRKIFDLGIAGGLITTNPAADLSKEPPGQKKLELPNKTEFAALVQELRSAGGWCSQQVGESSAQLFGPGLEARAKHRVEVFAEYGSLRASVSSLELSLYTSPKREDLAVALSAEMRDLNVAGPAVLSWSDCEQSLTL